MDGSVSTLAPIFATAGLTGRPLCAFYVGLAASLGAVACELLAIAFIRYRFMGGALANTIIQVVIGGALVFAIGLWLGRVGAG
jgi:hypothetical protein